MIPRDDIVRHARALIGTPYFHQQSVPHVGVDCLGLVKCVLRACSVDIKTRVDYPRYPNATMLLSDVRAHVPEKPISESLPGDLLILANRQYAYHMAVQTSESTLVHCDARQGVIEQSIAGLRESVRHCFALSAYV